MKMFPSPSLSTRNLPLNNPAKYDDLHNVVFVVMYLDPPTFNFTTFDECILIISPSISSSSVLLSSDMFRCCFSQRFQESNQTLTKQRGLDCISLFNVHVPVSIYHAAIVIVCYHCCALGSTIQIKIALSFAERIVEKRIVEFLGF